MSEVTRRGFFGRLAAVAAGAVALVTRKPSDSLWPENMQVGDPGWMHPDSPVARRIHAQYLGGSASKTSGFDWHYDQNLTAEIAEYPR